MDRYGELLVFVRAVSEGGFSAAARSLSLTPSAVSKLDSRLENRLGMLLSSRTIAPTPEGEAFHAAALRAIEAVEAAELAVAPDAALHDTLRIRSMPTFAALQLAPLVSAFRRQHPSLRIEIHLRMEPGNVLEGGALLRGPGVRAHLPQPRVVWGQAMRAEIGRPNSSMRLNAWTATFTSVTRRSSVRERSPSPITCLSECRSSGAGGQGPDAGCVAGHALDRLAEIPGADGRPPCGRWN